MELERLVTWFNDNFTAHDILQMHVFVDDEDTSRATGTQVMLCERYDCDIITTSRVVSVTTLLPGDHSSTDDACEDRGGASSDERTTVDKLVPAPMWTSPRVQWKAGGIRRWKSNNTSMYVFDSIASASAYLRLVRLVFDEFPYVRAVRRNSAIRLANLDDATGGEESEASTSTRRRPYTPRVHISD